MRSIERCRRGAAVLLCAALAGGLTAPATLPPARAQATGESVIPIEEILPLDGEEGIRKARDDARATAEDARFRLAVSKEREASAKAYLEAKKAEIEGLKKRIEAADKSKDEVQKKALEGDRKTEEQRQRLLERMLELRRVEAEYNEAQMQSAGLEESFQELALGLADVRKKTADPGSVISESERLGRNRELRQKEKDFVNAYRKWAEAARTTAEKRKAVSDRRADAYQSWLVVSGLNR